jgi:hypothetical protein
MRLGEAIERAAATLSEAGAGAGGTATGRQEVVDATFKERPPRRYG